MVDKESLNLWSEGFFKEIAQNLKESPKKQLTSYLKLVYTKLL